MSKLQTPYFLDTDGTVRNGKDLVVFEPFEYNEKELNAMLDALNTFDFLKSKADNADSLNQRIAVLEEALNQIAMDNNQNWDNGWGYAEVKRDMAINALAESKRIAGS